MFDPKGAPEAAAYGGVHGAQHPVRLEPPPRPEDAGATSSSTPRAPSSTISSGTPGRRRTSRTGSPTGPSSDEKGARPAHDRDERRTPRPPRPPTWTRRPSSGWPPSDTSGPPCRRRPPPRKAGHPGRPQGQVHGLRFREQGRGADPEGRVPRGGQAPRTGPSRRAVHPPGPAPAGDLLYGDGQPGGGQSPAGPYPQGGPGERPGPHFA